MNFQRPTREVAFLDTNTLHYIGLYLTYAEREQWFPWNTNDSSRAKVVLQELPRKHSAKKSLQRGLHALAHATQRSMLFRYSAIAELEMLAGRVRGRAILKQAQEGVPDRMWSRLQEGDLRKRVDRGDMEAAEQSVRNIGDALEQLGLAESTTARQRAGDTIEVAYGISSVVYLAPMDSLIYASSLLARANYLFTGDIYLRNTVNAIRESEGTAESSFGYGEIRAHIRTLMQSLGVQIDFPSAHTVTADGRVEPALPGLGAA